MPKTHVVSPSSIKALWSNWAISFGSISVVMLFPSLVTKQWVPFLVLALAFLLNVYLRNESAKEKIQSCPLPIRASIITLVWSAVVMFAIYLLFSKILSHSTEFVPFNPKHPYICSLIIYPVAAIVSLYMMIAGHSLKHCQHCRARYGYYPDDGIISALFFKETRYQLRMMFWLSAAISVANTVYYFVFYINVNYNSPDRFFFIIMPILVYGLSLVYMTARYMGMGEQLTRQFGNKPLRPIITLVRYLVFAEDSIFLAPNSDFYIDTPAKESVARVEKFPVDRARKDFEELSGLSDFETKYIYSDIGYTNGANIIHYAIFLPGKFTDSKLSGEWCTIDEVDRMLKAGNLDPMLAGEFNRIYKVTMAWKTYNREGKRLYPIKNYQPTFRFRDFKDWDVDYDDRHWLDVASNNEDKSFFRLRRLWRKNFRH